MTPPVKNLLTTGIFLASASIVLATSVREYQAMTRDQRIDFLGKETDAIISRIKVYDPQLAAKTRYYMLDETNSFGGALGLGAVLDVVSVTEQKHPEAMDKIQIETATKIIIQNYWKREGYIVPPEILGLKVSSPSAAATNAPAH